MRMLAMILTGLVLMTSPGCTAGQEPSETVTNLDRDIVVQGNNQFALELYQNLRDREGNVFFSPYSISTALAMT